MRDWQAAKSELGEIARLQADNERLRSLLSMAGKTAELAIIEERKAKTENQRLRAALEAIHNIASAPTQAPYINPGKAVKDIASAALSVSDENRNGENAERSRGEALPARCHNVTDALTLSPKEQKGD